ncbi:MAG: hypothetical protein KDA89_04035 [Planctomycetaceae bacterium]|nr:hypothetical protein [Planctomycetaceae bacterium]
MVQGNHQFQIAWLDESRREQAIRDMLECRNASGTAGNRRRRRPADYSMVVFEGNVAPTPELCGPLNAALKSPPDATRKPADGIQIWLGEPVAIAAPTRVELRRAGGQNLMIIGQDEKQVDSLLAYVVLSCCVNGSLNNSSPARDGDRSNTDSQRRLVLLHDGRDHEVVQRFRSLQSVAGVDGYSIAEPTECDAVIQSLYDTVVAREEDSVRANGPEQFLVIRNLGQFRTLRKDDDDFGLGGFGEKKAATAASMFGDIIKRGPVVGVHVIVWSDTFSNAIRWISNSLLREFETRIAFRMNQADSSSLLDSPVASLLTPGRAIVYRDQTGTSEKFRPFAWPSDTWLRSMTEGDPPPATDLDINSLIIE